jgi:Flp pilus assembly protein TadB
MNESLRSCVEEFERGSGEIGLLPALLYATLILIMTIVGGVVVLVLGTLVLVLSPLVLAVVLPALYLSRSAGSASGGAKPSCMDPWLSE